MKKELLNALKNLDIDTVIDFVDSEMKEIYKKTYDNPLSGWRYEITLDADGVLSVGLLSTGSTQMSVYEGEEVVLASIRAENGIEGDLTTSEVIDKLTSEEREKFIEEFKTCYLYYDEYDEENFNIYDYLNCEYINDIEECYKNLFSDKWEELIEDYIDNEWEGYSRDNLVDKICYGRDELIEYGEQE